MFLHTTISDDMMLGSGWMMNVGAMERRNWQVDTVWCIALGGKIGLRTQNLPCYTAGVVFLGGSWSFVEQAKLKEGGDCTQLRVCQILLSV
jgi:hypothetical protein